jgi:hypothetical protein
VWRLRFFGSEKTSTPPSYILCTFGLTRSIPKLRSISLHSKPRASPATTLASSCEVLDALGIVQPARACLHRTDPSLLRELDDVLTTVTKSISDLSRTHPSLQLLQVWHSNSLSILRLLL